MKKYILLTAFLLLLSLSISSCAGSIVGKWSYEDAVILIFERDGTLIVTAPGEDSGVTYTFSYEKSDGVLTVEGASVLGALMPEMIPLDGAAWSVDGRTLVLICSGEEYILEKVR